MGVSSREKGSTCIPAVAPIIRALECAFRPISLHKLPLRLSMHILKKIAAYISPWRPSGLEFLVFTFQRFGMQMAQWNKCMMCCTFSSMLQSKGHIDRLRCLCGVVHPHHFCLQCIYWDQIKKCTRTVG